MMARMGSGWQTTLTDLALILFMITASAVSVSHGGAAARPSPQAEPLAVWRAGAEAPPIEAWLEEQPRDARQLLTIRSAYAPGGQADAVAAAAGLARLAGQGGLAARIVVEPGEGGLSATLAYDRQPDLGTGLAAQGAGHPGLEL